MIRAVLTTLFAALASAAGRLTGPIFTKELRVSSRLRRNYWLRFVYVVLLTGVIVIVWVGIMLEYSGRQARSPAVRISRMSEVGQVVVGTVVWFQFCMTQLVAIVSLSTSISEEVYRRTLGVLLATPITAFQIVMGKLLSKLWQLLILIAVSLPVLAVVRVFGGVPWAFLVGSVCIHLTALLFVAALTMLFSVFCRRAYVCILATLVTMGLIFGLLALGIFVVLDKSTTFSDQSILLGLSYFNPYFAQTVQTVQGLQPGGMRGMWFRWPVHCGVMLAMTAGLLALCVVLVRRVGMRQIAGETGAGPNRAPAPVLPAAGGVPLPGGQTAPVLAPVEPPRPAGRIRRVHGPPMVWKELRGNWRRYKWRKILLTAGTVLVLGGMYLWALDEHALDDDDCQMAFLTVLALLATLVTMIVAATPVTSEKESQSWPSLLATTLGPWQILLGKAAGVVRRVLPVWLLLIAHVVLFTCVGYLHPIVALHLAMVVTSAVVTMTALGLYLGVRCRRTTTAVVLNIVAVAVLWVGLPWLPVGLVFLRGAPGPDVVTETWIDTNPVMQFVVVTIFAAGLRNARGGLAGLEYGWLHTARDWAQTTRMVWAGMALHFALAALVLWRAARRLRRSAF
ncbi:MAG TPA: ABC transporter permease subunit [Phycisphaerae bacterium]|nr:ABC transporter permease subunit [Phycisphaerae bacterium]